MTVGWLEKTFLYTFGLSGLVLLLHTTNMYRVVNDNRNYNYLILVSRPAPYYGKPSKPTTRRPG